MIRSYELGILVYPELFEETPDEIIHRENRNEKVKLKNILRKDLDTCFEDIPICLPYDLPLSRYSEEDRCWNVDLHYEGLLDLFGRKKSDVL